MAVWGEPIFNTTSETIIKEDPLCVFDTYYKKKGVLNVANRQQSLEIRNHINDLSGDLPDGYSQSNIC